MSFGPDEMGVDAPELGLEENPNPGRVRERPERKLGRRDAGWGGKTVVSEWFFHRLNDRAHYH